MKKINILSNTPYYSKPYFFYIRDNKKDYYVKYNSWIDLFQKVTELLFKMCEVPAEVIFDNRVPGKRVVLFSRTYQDGYFCIGQGVYVRNLANTQDVVIGIGQLLDVLGFTNPNQAVIVFRLPYSHPTYINFNNMDYLKNTLLEYYKDNDNSENQFDKELAMLVELDDTLKTVKYESLSLFQSFTYPLFVRLIKEAMMRYRGEKSGYTIAKYINDIIKATYGTRYATISDQECSGYFVIKMNEFLTIRFMDCDIVSDI